MLARIIDVPPTLPYFGPTPRWIDPNKSMVITTGTGRYIARDGQEVIVPEGYVSDLASTPRIMWSMIPPHGKLILGALPHDWGYSHGGKDPDRPKSFWDLLFRDLLDITPGIPRWKVTAAYNGVKCFGRGGWVKGWSDYHPACPPVWRTLGASHERDNTSR